MSLKQINESFQQCLRPCAHCGGVAEFVLIPAGDRTNMLGVSCKRCGITSKGYFAKYEYCAVDLVIKNWNKRPEGEPK